MVAYFVVVLIVCFYRCFVLVACVLCVYVGIVDLLIRAFCWFVN